MPEVRCFVALQPQVPKRAHLTISRPRFLLQTADVGSQLFDLQQYLPFRPSLLLDKLRLHARGLRLPTGSKCEHCERNAYHYQNA